MPHVIDFVPPIVGMNGVFNTFRLGLFYSKRLRVGDIVVLMDNKEKRIFGKAEVVEVAVGQLDEMLATKAFLNHAVIHRHEGHSEALLEILMRFYGPHIVSPTKKTTVVQLRRIHDDSSASLGGISSATA